MYKSIAGFLMAVCLLLAMSSQIYAAPAQTYNAQLEYLKVINAAGPVQDPQLIFLLMEQYLSTNQSEAGVEFFESFLDKHRASLSSERQSLYLTALSLLRAAHAKDVFLFRRPGWVRETIAMLEEGKKLSGHQGFVAHWAAGYVYTERLIDGVNQKMLIQQLKQLEKDGIVERTVYPEVPPRVEYTLGALGIALGPSMKALIEWAEMRRRLRGEVTAK
jgi:hypothetical protein